MGKVKSKTEHKQAAGLSLETKQGLLACKYFLEASVVVRVEWLMAG